MEFNPVLVRKFISTQSFRKTKTDKIDCEYIANHLMTIEYKPYPSRFYNIYSLKSLVRLYDSLVRNKTFYIVKLTNLLDHIFPEFKAFFNERLGKTTLYILSNYPSIDKISNMSNKVFDTLHRISRGRFSSNNFVKLKSLAKNSIGNSNPFFELQLLSLISLFNECNKQVNLLKSNIDKIMKTLNPHILSIPGIGSITAAIIYSEIGNFNSFSLSDKIVAFAGLDVGLYQSGISEYTRKMVKHGSPYCVMLL